MLQKVLFLTFLCSKAYLEISLFINVQREIFHIYQ